MVEKRKVESFEDLRVWQNGLYLVKQIYLLTKQGELNKDFYLKDQLRRASVSIPTNIAEGFERHSRKEYLYFLNIAKGSAGEVRSLLRVALEIGYLDQQNYTHLYTQIKDLSRMLFNQIQAINNREEGERVRGKIFESSHSPFPIPPLNSPSYKKVGDK